MFDPLRRSDPDEFVFPWLEFFVYPWEPGATYAVDDVVRPRAPNGVFARCATAGQSAAREPAWGDVGAIRRDGKGTLTWEMVDPSTELPTIQSVTYTITPDGIAQTATNILGAQTKVKLDASAAALGTYTILAEIVTVDGEDHSQQETVEVID